MPRLPRFVLSELPHNITQRCNRRERTFFKDGDYALYLDLLVQVAGQGRVEIRSYCVMPNHIHSIAVPKDVQWFAADLPLRAASSTGYINDRLRTAGHLWQGWFLRVAIDGEHVHHVFRLSRLTRHGQDWRSGRKNGARPALRRIWRLWTTIWSRVQEARFSRCLLVPTTPP